MPQWITDWVTKLRDLLGLESGWRILVVLREKPGGDDHNGGACMAESIYLNATLEFHEAIQPDDVGHQTVCHEMLHVAHAEVDHVVLSILDNVPKGDRGYFDELYHEATERYIQRTSRSLTPFLEEQWREE